MKVIRIHSFSIYKDIYLTNSLQSYFKKFIFVENSITIIIHNLLQPTFMGKRKKPINFDSKRLYYSIQEVADHFAVNISLLRFWEKEFSNIKPKKTTGGTRQYTREDVMEIAVVYRLVKEKGLTLEGARQALKTNKTDEDLRIETLSRLQNIKKELLQLEEEFDTLHQQQKYSTTKTEN